jgi:hypothetical protein
MNIGHTKKMPVKIMFSAILFFLPLSGLVCGEGKVEPQKDKIISPEPSEEKNICIKIGVGYFFPSEKSFKDIYGEGVAIGGEIDIKLWKFIDLWLIGNYYSKKGHLPFTKEETKMTLIPIGGGPKIRFQSGITNIYIGLGPVFYVYKEKNPIGVAKGTGTGIIGQAGCYFNIIDGLLFDVSVNYSYCSVKPQKLKADLGGIQAGLSLGYEF